MTSSAYSGALVAERWASAAAGSRSDEGAKAVGSQLHALVRRSRRYPTRARSHVVLRSMERLGVILELLHASGRLMNFLHHCEVSVVDVPVEH